jgi:hypothetical protein
MGGGMQSKSTSQVLEVSVGWALEVLGPSSNSTVGILLASDRNGRESLGTCWNSRGMLERAIGPCWTNSHWTTRILSDVVTLRQKHSHRACLEDHSYRTLHA